MLVSIVAVLLTITALIFVTQSFLCRSFGWLAAIAAAPTFLTLYSTALLHLTPGSGLLPLAATLPLIMGSTLIIYWLKPREVSYRFSADWISWNSLFVIALVPTVIFFMSVIVQQSVHSHIDNDFSVYSLEASRIARTLLDGGTLKTFFDQIGIAHPHSMSFSYYLTWGFLTADQPGFTQDQLPRLLIALNQFAAIAGILFFISSLVKLKFYWILIAATIILATAGWEYQLRALGRDTYAIAPLFVAMGLLARARPWQNTTVLKSKIVPLGFLTVLVFSALQTHTLSVIYLGSAGFALGFVYLIRFRLKAFAVAELWLAGTLILLFVVQTLLKYMQNEAGEMGFAYPYYVDPVLRENFETGRSFLTDIHLVPYIKKLVVERGIGLWWITIALAFGSIIGRLHLSPSPKKLAKVEIAWLLVLSMLAVCLLATYFFPIKLDNIALRSAFVANFRYSFVMEILAYGLVIISLSTVLHAIETLLDSKIISKLLVCVLVGCAIWQMIETNKRVSAQVSKAENQIALAQNSVCQYLYDQGVKRIAIDSNGFRYRCNSDHLNGLSPTSFVQDVLYLFSEEGTRILKVMDITERTTALAELGIDVVILDLSEKGWWAGASLYEYLEDNWAKLGYNRLKIYIRPDLRSTIDLPNYADSLNLSDGLGQIDPSR